jgi:hypothetical protein
VNPPLNVEYLVLLIVLDYKENPLEINLPCVQDSTPNPTALFPS